jgi:hypothetical protein
MWAVKFLSYFYARFLKEMMIYPAEKTINNMITSEFQELKTRSASTQCR